MKTKKTYLVLPILTVVLAAASFLLRRGQVLTAFEETGLLVPGSGYTYALAAVWALAAVSAAGLSWWMGKGLTNSIKAGLMPEGYTPYFTQGVLPALAVTLAGGLMLCAGALTLGKYFGHALVGKMNLVWGVAMALAGVCVCLVGWCNLDKTRLSKAEPNRTRGNLFAGELLAPGAAGCVWMIWIYQNHTANPCVWEYAPQLLGVICAAVGCLTIASFSFEKVRPVLAPAACSMGVVLLAANLADCLYFTFDPFRPSEVLTAPLMLATAGTMLYLFLQSATLTFRLVEPAETAEDEKPDENHQDTL